MLAAGDGAGKIGDGLLPDGLFEPPGFNDDQPTRPGTGGPEDGPKSGVRDLPSVYGPYGIEAGAPSVRPADGEETTGQLTSDAFEYRMTNEMVYEITHGPISEPERGTRLPARLLNPGLDRNLHPDISTARRIVYRVRTVLAGWRTHNPNVFLPIRSAGGSNIEYRIQPHRPDTESEAMRIMVRGNLDNVSLFLQLLTRRANVAPRRHEEIQAEMLDLAHNDEWLARKVANSDLFFFLSPIVLSPVVEKDSAKYSVSIWWDRIEDYSLTSSDNGEFRGNFIARGTLPHSQMDDTAFQLALRDFRSDITPARGTPSPTTGSSVKGLVEDTGETSGGANVEGAAHVHPATRSTAGRSQRRYGHTQLAGARTAVRTASLRPIAAPLAGRATVVR